MLSYLKFTNHHIGEVEALVENFFLPKAFRFLQMTKEQVKPELVELLAIHGGKDWASEYVNTPSFVCKNEKGNVVGALCCSYLDQEQFMYESFHKYESFLKLQINHDIPAKSFALAKRSLYKRC